jgi:hypothetical protein
VAGAGSGAWYTGDFGLDGTPMALQREGAPKGYLVMDFDGNTYTTRYVGANVEFEDFWASLSTPAFREWFAKLDAWRGADPDTRSAVPPVNINDLPDTHLVTPEDLAAGVDLVANVWMGDRDTIVRAEVDGQTLTLARTQEGGGEGQRSGARFADPFATERQLQVARWAFEPGAESKTDWAWQAWQGSSFDPAPPQPQFHVADRNVHLWTARLPTDLEAGVHTVRLTVTYPDGRTAERELPMEVRQERPRPDWDPTLWTEDD